MLVKPFRGSPSHRDTARSKRVRILYRRRKARLDIANEAAARLAAIVDSSADAIAGMTLDGIVTSWNESAGRLFGYDAGEIAGRSIRILIPGERQDEEDEILARIAGGKPVKSYDTCRLHKNGRPLAVAITVSPILDAKGAIIGASTSMRDITARKHEQEVRRQAEDSERRKRLELEAVLEAIPASIYIAGDETCTHITANRAGYEFLGVAAGDEVSKSSPPNEIPQNHEILSNGRVLPPEEMPMRRAASTRSAIRGAELEFRFSDGEIRHAMGNALPILDDLGQVRGVIGAFLDITAFKRNEAALKQSEARLAAALRAGKLGAYDYDPQSGAIRWDQTANRLWGLPDGHPVTFEIFEAGLHPDDVPKMRAAMAQSLDPGGAGRYECEYRIAGKADGTVRWIQAEGDVTFKGATPLRMVGIVQDITARKLQEEAANILQRRDRYMLGLEARLRNAGSAKEAVDSAAEALGRELGVAFAGISEVERGAAQYLTLSVWTAGTAGTLGPHPGSTYPLDRRVAEIAASLDGQPVAINDASSDPRTSDPASRAIYSDLGIHSSLMAPILRDGELRAFLFAADVNPRAWTDVEIALATETIGRLWHAVERARAEDAVRESEERLRLANEAACIGTFTIDLKSGRALYSPELAEMLGFPGVLAANVEAALARVHRDDLPVVAKLYDAAVAGADGGHLKMDFRFVRPGGEIRWMTWIGRADFHDRPSGRAPFRIVGACLDITDRKRQEEQIDMLMREVDHRAKNMLSLVQVIARRTAASSAGDFTARFDERLQALASSQELLVRSAWKGIGIAELLRSQLAHFRDLLDLRIALEGAPVSVSASAAQTIGMAIHELGTNAGKYGALSNNRGRVDIAWEVVEEGGSELFKMSWRESKGPIVHPPSKMGFGSTVTTQLVERGLDACVELEFKPDGLTWQLRCPAGSVLEDDR